MKYNFTYIFLLLFSFLGTTQEVGDTIKVSVLDYSMNERDVNVEFPSNDLSFEKIIMKYNMRCTDGLVSNPNESNKGCGEWDYSCNSYVVDSNKVEAIISNVENYYFVGSDETSLPYSNTPRYNYVQFLQQDVDYTINSENSHPIGFNDGTSTDVIDTGLDQQQTYTLFTAAEMIASGITEGAIAGLSMGTGNATGEVEFFSIKIKHTTKASLLGDIEFDGFTEVYANDKTFTSNEENRFQFYTPFMWDGSSNIIVETSFNNSSANTGSTEINGTMALDDQISSDNGQEMILTNSTYIEANDYLGIGGSTHRTIEAWIKTSEITNGEILSYATDANSKKWVFRTNGQGQLRVEINGGATVGTTNIIDGKWHHVACVLNGNNLSNISFYIDGVKETNSSVGTLTVNTELRNKVRISRGINNRYHDGSIDEVRMWDTALSEETIKSWMRMDITPDHPNYENLQLNYTFDEEANDKNIIDQSGNGRDGYIYNGDPIRIASASNGDLFKEYQRKDFKPMVTFYQGDYTSNITEEERNMAFESATTFVIKKTIVPATDPTFAISDQIINSIPTAYYATESKIYDYIGGEVVDTWDFATDGILTIENLDYTVRFPYYNEILSFVTPYGIYLDLGIDGKTWYYDVTDYKSILTGNKRFLMTLGGQHQEQMDIEFWFIVGTPMRDVIEYNQLWQGAGRIGSNPIAAVRDGSRLPTIDVPLSSEGEQFVIKSTITGHGSQGEFAQNGGLIFHSLNINDGEEENIWNIEQECSLNPIYPQGGTWIYDRQGWCPGETSHTEVFDITEGVTAGDIANIDYDISAPQSSTGDYRYIVAHQLVTYGKMNFEKDARILEVINPTDIALYGRINPVCETPIVQIQNSGIDEITSMTITYRTNNNDNVTFEWTGSLESQEIRDIELPTNGIFDDLKTSGNKAYFELTKVNGSSDDYAHNNYKVTSFEVADHMIDEFIVYVKTNTSSSHNSYKIYDEDDNLIFSNPLTLANKAYRDTFKLNGCFRLEMVDLGSDGLSWFGNSAQGTGNFSIRKLDNSEVRSFNPDFGSGITYNFSAETTTGVIDQELTDKINLFPNPATDYVTLSMESDKRYEIECYDILGKKINVNYSFSGKEYQLDVRALSGGIYMVKVLSEGKYTTRKFVKSK